MEGYAITLGNFDGVHLGHRALFDKTLAIGEKFKIPTLAITYHPHPAIVLGKKQSFTYLQPLEERQKLILSLGLGRVEILPFTPELSEMDAETFIEDILVQKFHAKHIIIGYNHNFGKNRRGNYQLLEELSAKYGYKVYEVEPVYLGEEKISSSLIRHYLQAGDLEKANACLGRTFALQNTVQTGKKLGRLLGYPTANLSIPKEQVVPSHGVYASYTNGKPSITNIGTKPTFDDKSISIETHILDWDGDLYNQIVRVEFLKKMRNVTKFITPDQLKDQLGKDEAQARKILSLIIHNQ